MTLGRPKTGTCWDIGRVHSTVVAWRSLGPLAMWEVLCLQGVCESGASGYRTITEGGWGYLAPHPLHEACTGAQVAILAAYNLVDFGNGWVWE